MPVSEPSNNTVVGFIEKGGIIYVTWSPIYTRIQRKSCRSLRLYIFVRFSDAVLENPKENRNFQVASHIQWPFGLPFLFCFWTATLTQVSKCMFWSTRPRPHYNLFRCETHKHSTITWSYFFKFPLRFLPTRLVIYQILWSIVSVPGERSFSQFLLSHAFIRASLFPFLYCAVKNRFIILSSRIDSWTGFCLPTLRICSCAPSKDRIWLGQQRRHRVVLILVPFEIFYPSLLLSARKLGSCSWNSYIYLVAAFGGVFDCENLT